MRATPPSVPQVRVVNDVLIQMLLDSNFQRSNTDLPVIAGMLQSES